MAEKEEAYGREQSMDIEDQELQFRNVTFGYGDEDVIKNASFTIPKGKVTVIAGPNGSGKTTVFKLIERFYIPDSGELYFGPYKAENIHLDEWRQSIAYVLQEPQLFNGTIRENINYGMEREILPEETESAAKLACADDFIKELPEGYDFVIGDNGNRLSAGQRQRIAIARAVMLDPSYLLLDEATCNMDIYSEKAVTQALFSLMQGRTTVMISHDMKMLEKADHIIVINNGNIEAEGTEKEVLAKSPTLADYHDAPFERNIKISCPEEYVESQLKHLTRNYKRTEAVDIVESGDVAVLALKSEMEKYNRPMLPLTVGKNLFDEELESALIGHSVGEEFIVKVQNKDVYGAMDEVLNYVLTHSDWEFDDSEIKEQKEIALSEIKEQLKEENKELESLTTEELDAIFGVSSLDEFEEEFEHSIEQNIATELWVMEITQIDNLEEFEGNPYEFLENFVRENVMITEE